MEDWDTKRWLARTLAWEKTLSRLREADQASSAAPKELRRKKVAGPERVRHAARLPRPSTAA
jgi:hypothetical protein